MPNCRKFGSHHYQNVSILAKIFRKKKSTFIEGRKRNLTFQVQELSFLVSLHREPMRINQHFRWNVNKKDSTSAEISFPVHRRISFSFTLGTEIKWSLTGQPGIMKSLLRFSNQPKKLEHQKLCFITNALIHPRSPAFF